MSTPAYVGLVEVTRVDGRVSHTVKVRVSTADDMNDIRGRRSDTVTAVFSDMTTKQQVDLAILALQTARETLRETDL